MGSVKTKIVKIIGSPFFIPAVGVALMALLLLSVYLPKSKKEESVKPDTAQYSAQLEARLENMVKSIDGVEDCDVMITLKSGTEYKYASDTQTSDSSDADAKKSVSSKSDIAVISDKENGESAVVIKEIYPEIMGVAVVCRGRYSDSLKLEIAGAVSTVLGTGIDKVFVLIK